MRRIAAIAIASVLAGGAPRAGALDFVLRTKSVQDDGLTREQSYVTNDDHSDVWLTLPARWTRTDNPASLTLTPPDVPNSVVRLEKSSLAPSTDFRAPGLDTYRRRVQADIPQGATNVQFREEHDNPLPIYGWKDHEFVLSYDFFGQSYKRSALFINLNAREQIVLTCVAPAEGFDAVRGAGLDMLRSWQVMPSNG